MANINTTNNHYEICIEPTNTNFNLKEILKEISQISFHLEKIQYFNFAIEFLNMNKEDAEFFSYYSAIEQQQIDLEIITNKGNKEISKRLNEKKKLHHKILQERRIKTKNEQQLENKLSELFNQLKI